MKFPPVRLFLALMLCLPLASCGGGAGADLPDDYVAARGSWQAAHISNYRFTLGQVCLCPSKKSDRVVIVRDGKVVAANYADGTSVDAADIPRLPSMSDMFATIDEAYARGLTVRFATNSEYGDLREVYIDYISGAADDELRYIIRSFSIDG